MRVSEDMSFAQMDILCPDGGFVPPSLGAVEYWIVDEEGGEAPLIKSSCPPFMLSPGYRVAHSGKPGVYREAAAAKDLPPLQPGTFGLGSLGFWEIRSRGGENVIAAFRCRPFWIDPHLEVEQVVGGRLRRMSTRGRHVFP